MNNNDSFILDAGSYGSLDVGNNATVILTGGIYAFSEWSIGNNVHILIQAPVDIWIAGRLDSGPNGSLSSDPASALTAKDIHLIVTGQNGDDGSLAATPVAVEFNNNYTITASVYAPNGTLEIKNNGNATGAFIGKWVTIGNNATFALDSGW